MAAAAAAADGRTDATAAAVAAASCCQCHGVFVLVSYIISFLFLVSYRRARASSEEK